MSRVIRILRSVTFVTIYCVVGLFILSMSGQYIINFQKDEALEMSKSRWVVSKHFHQPATSQNNEYISVTLVRLDEQGNPVASLSDEYNDRLTRYTTYVDEANPDFPKYRTLEEGMWVYLEYHEESESQAEGLFNYLGLDTNVLETRNYTPPSEAVSLQPNLNS